MAQAAWPLEERGFGQTTRRDTWWVQSLLTFLGFSAFILYSTWAAFQGNHYEFGPYLSPFYSPLLFGDGPHAWFGPKPGWWPAALPFSAALIILWARAGSGSPATTTAAPTTRRSGRTRRGARSGSRGARTGVSGHSPSFFRTSTATSFTSRCCS